MSKGRIEYEATAPELQAEAHDVNLGLRYVTNCVVAASDDKLRMVLSTDGLYAEDGPSRESVRVRLARICDWFALRFESPVHGLREQSVQLPRRHTVAPSLPFSITILRPAIPLAAADTQFGAGVVAGLSPETLELIHEYASAIQETSSIARFSLLYNLALRLCSDGDFQEDVDREMLRLDPECPCSPSPKKAAKTETVYTRLRNQLSHHRGRGVPFDTTRQEVEMVIGRFAALVATMLRKSCADWPAEGPAANR